MSQRAWKVAPLVISVIALLFSTTGLADAARHAIVAALAGHPISTKPHSDGLLLLGQDAKFPASAIPTVRSAENATALNGKSAQDLTPTCPSSTESLGTWCLEISPYPLTPEEQGENNYFWASKRCVEEGGWLPTTAELIGAAARVKLESTIKDNPATATIPLDSTRGLKDEREMSSTLVTTEAGSAAAGSEGVSEGATGNPRQGQPNPIPQPANPDPESLQYVTVYSNGTKGGFAGSEPVGDPQNFRCAYDKVPDGVSHTPGVLNKTPLGAGNKPAS